MKIPSQSKIEKVTSTDKSREILHHVSIQTIEGIGEPGQTFAVATDGMALAAVPVETEHAEEKPCALLTREQVAKVKKADHCSLNGKLEFPDGSSEPIKAKEYGQFPNVKMVIPAKDRKVTFAVCLDAELLVNLQRAFGSGAVKLVFEDEMSSIKVTPKNNTRRGKKYDNPVIGSFGVLMPCRMS